MNRRYVLFGAIAALLVLLNVWRWMPFGADARSQDVDSTGTLRLEDFALRVTSLPIEPGPMRRDLFHAQPSAPKRAANRVPAAPPGPPPKSPEEIAAEEARSMLADIKVIGIVFRDGVGQAYVTVGGQSQLVRVGDVVGERFRVEEIRQDAVELADGATDTRGRVPLTGT